VETPRDRRHRRHRLPHATFPSVCYNRRARPKRQAFHEIAHLLGLFESPSDSYEASRTKGSNICATSSSPRRLCTASSAMANYGSNGLSQTIRIWKSKYSFLKMRPCALAPGDAQPLCPTQREQYAARQGGPAGRVRQKIDSLDARSDSADSLRTRRNWLVGRGRRVGVRSYGRRCASRIRNRRVVMARDKLGEFRRRVCGTSIRWICGRARNLSNAWH
jgi:hypothetical protein